MNPEHSSTIKAVCDLITAGDHADASRVITAEYPFHPVQKAGRKYSPTIMTSIFLRDGFIDRYRGTKLIFPPVLHLLSHYLPEEFPYHPNWKMSETHIAYWELFPTIDHIVPVSRGGTDSENNWVSCSMLTNSIKSNWTLEELGWNILLPGDLSQWDGMAHWFLHQVEIDPAVLEIDRIQAWHKAITRYSGRNTIRLVISSESSA